MTMRLCAKIRGVTKRQAVARLSPGRGATGPEHAVELPREEARHNTPAITQEGKEGSSQVFGI